MTMPIVIAVLAAGFVSSFTDWLFMGVLFHNRYNTYPEVWRPGISSGKERGAILWSTAISFVTPAAIIALCAMTGIHGLADTLLLSVLVWAAGPLTVTITNALFVKFDPLVTTAHALGYLARFVIAGFAATWALS